MAVATSIADVGSFSVEHLTFGKLVEEADGPIARAAESEITSASAGLDRLARPALAPQFFTGPEPWEPSDLCVNSRQRGALLVRPIQLTDDGPFYLAAARIRYRPEAGEGMAGRITAQSSARIFDLADWSRNAPFIADQILPALEARPDLSRRRKHDRLFEPPLSFRPRRPSDIAMNRIPNGVWQIVNDLAEERRCHLGIETFENEAAFLQGMARVFDLLDETAVQALGISWTAGYRRPDPQYAVQYFPDRTLPERHVLRPLHAQEAQIRGERWRRFSARVRDAFRDAIADRESLTAEQHFQTLQAILNGSDGDLVRPWISVQISRIDDLLGRPATRQQGQGELLEFVRTVRLLFPAELENLAGFAHISRALAGNADNPEFAEFVEASAQIAHIVARVDGTAEGLHCCEQVLAGGIERLAQGDSAPMPIFAVACRQLVLHRRDRVLDQARASLTRLAAGQFGGDARAWRASQFLALLDDICLDLARGDPDIDQAIPVIELDSTAAGAICDAPLVPSLSTHLGTVQP